MTAALRVLIPGARAAFEDPTDVWSGDVRSAFERAEHEMRAGQYVAGYVSYEGRATLGAFRTAFDWEPSTRNDVVSCGPLFPVFPFERYREHVDRTLHAIYDGDVYQVNYSVPFEAAFDADPYALWERVQQNASAPYAAFVSDERSALLSWSPELFLRFDASGRVTTKPMKGTALPGDVATLLNAKNRAEHVMIVDLLRNDLQRSCDDVRVDALCEMEHYPSFSTMTSTISAQRRGTIADTFITAFPCGSITGAPKRAAMEAIARAEQRERGIYCGSIGFLRPDGSGWWNVAIRTATVSNGVLHYAAGGGIVSDSSARDEWQEVHVKSRILARRSAPFEIWETYAARADVSTRSEHRARLCTTAYDLGVPFDPSTIDAAFDHEGEGLVRVRLRSDGSTYVRFDALETPDDAVVLLAEQRVRSSDANLRYKTSHRPVHDAAWAQARARGAFDALLCNEHGRITEGTRTNVFLERDGTFLTPPLDEGVLPGILRARLLREGRAIEARLTPDDVMHGRLYVGNSARGLLPVRLEVAQQREAIT